ncbi:MAG: hypothetical protein KAU62_15550 [Candidatus Heimdallarchaeota archaeon]|nr:hypothetical protein [Candidatus Heimdallarchaeota archaeon]MCG3257518.1 hypothetical protein [Candidatus Heimdallarchaeota archaeon]MCK4612570.1 hypothetical protein [Candidatus Heimdallarchaeota archaeon]
MNRKKTILTLVVLGLFITSIYVADVSKAVLVSDQLDLVVGTYVNGKLLYTNSTLTDHLLGYIDITVEDAFVATDTGDSLFKVKVAYDISTHNTDYLDFGDFNSIEMTHVIVKTNRTDILPSGTLYMGNDTFGVTMTTLHNTTVVGMMDIDNLKITFNNGTEYIYGDVVSSPLLSALGEYAFGWAIFNGIFATYWDWTFLAISPLANVGDTVSYDPDLGIVLDKPAVITSTGASFDTIHVEYLVATYGLAFDITTALEVFYDAKTGLILKTIETYGSDKVEFIPGEVKNVVGIPFSTTAIIAALTVLSTLALIVRKRRTK